MRAEIKRCLFLALFVAGAFTTVFAGELESDTVIQPTRRAPGIARTLSGIGMSGLINCGITEGLKNSIHKMRPNRSDNHSFPSRHTSWAFTLSSIASVELHHLSPWWVLAAQSIATGIGIQRVWSRHHYGTDVFAGMLVGIGSTAVGYWLGDIIYGKYTARTAASYNSTGVSVDIESSGSFVFDGHWGDGVAGVRILSGYGCTAQFRQPFRGSWYAVAQCRVISFPVEVNGECAGVLNAAGAEVGFGKVFALGKSYGTEAEGVFGCSALLGSGEYEHANAAFTAGVRLKFVWQISKRLACGISAGYGIMTVPAAVSSVSAGCFSRVCF